MKSVFSAVFLLGALVPSILAQRPGQGGPGGGGGGAGGPGGPGGPPRCGTVYGPRSTLVGRKTTTITSTFSSTRTITKTTLFTTTPARVTVSLTQTSVSTSTTTLSTPTNTISTTLTETTTTVLSETDTQTTTSVQTVTTSAVSTSTIGTPAGFIPIESSLTEVPPPVFKKKRYEPRRVNPRENKFESDKKSQKYAHDAFSPEPGYPQSVKCTVTISTTRIITKTNTVSSTVTARTPSTTVTTTTTSLSISTFNPAPASLTSTFRTTEISTSVFSTTQTLTETTTTTSTSYTSTTTTNLACATNNLLASYNNAGIGGFGYSAAYYVVEPLVFQDVPSGLECCLLAAQEPNAWFYAWIVNVDVCQVITGEFCPVPTEPVVVAPGTTRTAAANVAYATPIPSGGGFTVGNGACGVVETIYDGTPPEID